MGYGNRQPVERQYFFAYDELKEWLGEPGEIIAALSLGYTRRPVCPLPRKPLEELVSFK